MNLVHGPQAPGQGLLLPAALLFEPLTLPAKRCDVRLGLPDAAVEASDVALLVGQALLDPIELGEDRGLLLARLPRPPPLFPPFLLRPPPLPLLRLRRVVLLRLRQRVTGGQHADHRECGERAVRHDSERPRARKPP